MKVPVDLTIRFFAPPGAVCRLDSMNRTEVRLNGEKIPAEYANRYVVPSVAVGDTIAVGVPSGWFQCVVTSIDHVEGEPDVLHAKGQWDGKEAGLLAGMSGIVWWECHPADDSMVESSVWDKPIPYGLYRRVKALVDDSAAWAVPLPDEHLWPEHIRWPQVKQARMRDLVATVQAWWQPGWGQRHWPQES